MSIAPTYSQLRESFAWDLPPNFNIGLACADRHPADALALIEIAADGSRRESTFGDLTIASNRLANALRGIGCEFGDRVAIVLPQGAATGIAHLAAYKLGAVALPLSGLFGPDALRHRLGNSACRFLITDAEHVELIEEIAAELGGIELIVVDGVGSGHRDYWTFLGKGSADFTGPATTLDTPALLIYTSGTTGPAKGALHGHRVLLGHLPGFELAHEFFPQDGDVFWTPADWAWIGGLMDALLPSWYHGRPVVAASRAKFDPEWAAQLIESEAVRNLFLPPTALKIMREASAKLPRLKVRTVLSGGEPLDEAVLDWAREYLGVTINEIYGQTEANLVVGNCSPAWEVRPGSMGKPYPGHEVAVLGPDEEPVDDGELGEIAVRVGDPVMFLGYWENPEATAAKFTPSGEWMLTGDIATRDAAGYLWFSARNDDVINSAGYRIGPTEIESCLTAHPAVVMAAVIGVPDELRGEAVKAYIRLGDDQQPSEELEAELRQHVRGRIASYLYPRQIEFIDELPMTTTGKIRRDELRRLAAGNVDG